MPLIYSFKPFINETSRILILGSMPSVKSLEQNFYYMNKQNRFWKIIGILVGSTLNNIEDYKNALNCLHIALFDVIKSCERQGSADSKIKNIEINNISALLNDYPYITKIINNGKMSYNLYNKYIKDIKVPNVYLPSTSPANARFSLETLAELYKHEILIKQS